MCCNTAAKIDFFGDWGLGIGDWDVEIRDWRLGIGRANIFKKLRNIVLRLPLLFSSMSAFSTFTIYKDVQSAPELFSGADNLKPISIVYIYDGVDERNRLTDFLKRIFLAAKHDIHTEATLYPLTAQEKTKLRLADLLSGTDPRYIFVFGIKPSEMGLNIQTQVYTPLKWSGSTLLFADALPQIETQQEKKQLLWRALQQIFDIAAK